MPTRVVIADGSRLLCEMLGQALARVGIEAVNTRGPEALAQAAQQPGTTCVLLDADPEGEGWQPTLGRLRAATASVSVPVILLTSRATRALVVEAARAGVADVILKCPEIGSVVLSRLRRFGGPAPAEGSGRGADAVPGEIRAGEQPRAAVAARPADAEPAPASAGPSLASALAELKASKPLMSKTHLLDAVDDRATLRALSPVARQVLTMAGGASASLEEVARAVKQDPAICVKILRLANSSAYGTGARIDSVHKAVSRIGLAQIRDAVMNLEIVDRFSGKRCGTIRPDWFWEHSIAVGVIASRLARRGGAGPEVSDAMFTAGLLHDIGRMLLTEVIPGPYTSVLETAERLQLPLELVESRLLMVNHADLTDRVLRAWKFPPELINPIAFHHLPMGDARRSVPGMVESVAVLGLANRMAHALLIGSSGNEVIYPTREHLLGLSVEPALADALCEEVPPETAEMRMVLMSRAADIDTMSFDGYVRARLEPFGPLISLSGAPGLDPFDRVVARLGERDPDAPKAAVVYLQNAHEAVAAGAQLDAREKQLGRALPAVVVSPTGTVALPPAPGRRVQLLACPLTIGRLRHALEAVVGTAEPPDVA